MSLFLGSRSGGEPLEGEGGSLSPRLLRPPDGVDRYTSLARGSKSYSHEMLSSQMIVGMKMRRTLQSLCCRALGACLCMCSCVCVCVCVCDP